MSLEIVRHTGQELGLPPHVSCRLLSQIGPEDIKAILGGAAEVIGGKQVWQGDIGLGNPARSVRIVFPSSYQDRLIIEMQETFDGAAQTYSQQPFMPGAVILRGESFFQKDHPIKRIPSVTFVEPAHKKDGKLVASGVTLYKDGRVEPFQNSRDSLILKASRLATA